MCGRFYIDGVPSREGQVGSHQLSLTLTPNSDIRPTQPLSIVVANQSELQTKQLNWGIKPDWSNKLLINARSETILQKSFWRSTFAARRCLIPLSGWYEWQTDHEQTTAPKKQKYKFTGKAERLLWMAGIYWPKSDLLETGAVVSLTVYPNKTCAPYHDRQPLLLPDQFAWDYLTFPEPDPLHSLFHPVAEDQISVIKA